MVEDCENDPILEKINHQLFHLVDTIQKLTDKIEYVGEELDGLTTEIFKYRMNEKEKNLGH